MRKYIILRANITGMGGAQMYVRNKAEFEKNKGSAVYIFSSQAGEIVIHDLKPYQKNMISELNLSPMAYSHKTQEKIVAGILSTINYCVDDEVLIESNDVVMSIWGEIIAEKVRGKHLVYILNENFSSEEKHYYNFYDFKHRRREIAGINKNSIRELFSGYKLINEDEAYSLVASCVNVVEECENPVTEQLDPSAIKICSIGRLNKKYVSVICDEIVFFAEQHMEKRFQVIFIGDSPIKADRKKIREKFATLSNVNVLITGYMFPIPRKLFPQIDVFVSCAGSANTSYREDRPTISVENETGLAIGILGFDTLNTVNSQKDDVVYPISEGLEKVLFKNVTPKQYYSKEYSINALQSHDLFIDQSVRESEYFNFSFIDRSNKEKIFYMFSLLLGRRITSSVVYPLLRKLYSRGQKK